MLGFLRQFFPQGKLIAFGKRIWCSSAGVQCSGPFELNSAAGSHEISDKPLQHISDPCFSRSSQTEPLRNSQSFEDRRSQARLPFLMVSDAQNLHNSVACALYVQAPIPKHFRTRQE